MKKTIITLALTVSVLFLGCKQNTDGLNEERGFTVKTYNNISSLFITNPTDYNKPDNSTWLYSAIQARSATEEDEEIQESVANSKMDLPKSPTFYGDYSLMGEIPSSARNNEPTIFHKDKEFSFEKGNKRNMKNDWAQDSFLNKGVVFECAYVSDYCYIWIPYKSASAEPDELDLTKEEIEEFAKRFDKIYVKEISLVGDKYNGDAVYSNIIAPNDKISILLYDINGDKENGFYYGYYSSGDMLEDYDNCKLECIHVDSYYSKQENTRDELYSTLAHELNHKLNYDNKLLKYGSGLSSWCTEMLSMLIEDFFYEDLGISVLQSSQSRLLNFINGGYVYGFKNWTQTEHNVEGYMYSNAYAFGAFLARNYGGADLIYEIATNPYVDEEAVVEAVNKINGTNLTFQDLLAEFPAVLLNLDGNKSNLPTLNQGTESVINGFTYKLNPISVKIFEELVPQLAPIIAYPNFYNKMEKNPLYAYGFQWYKFNNPTNIKIKSKSELIITTY